jgi:hypothetical protein
LNVEMCGCSTVHVRNYSILLTKNNKIFQPC